MTGDGETSATELLPGMSAVFLLLAQPAAPTAINADAKIASFTARLPSIGLSIQR
jgi:hypothetical protein